MSVWQLIRALINGDLRLESSFRVRVGEFTYRIDGIRQHGPVVIAELDPDTKHPYREDYE